MKSLKPKLGELPFRQTIFFTGLFVLAPLYFHPNLGGEGLRIPNNVIVWWLISLAAWAVFFRISNSGIILVPKQITLIFAFPLLATFSELLKGFRFLDASVFTLLAVWISFLFFLYLFQLKLTPKQTNKILILILVGAFAQCIAGIVQMNYFNPAISFMPGLGQSNTTPYGFFQQINNQATYQVTCLVIALNLICSGDAGKRPSIWRVGLLVYIFTASFIIAASGSRVGLLSFVIALPLTLVGAYLKSKSRIKQILAASLMIVLGGFSGSHGIEHAGEKLESELAETTSSNRLGIYAVSAELIIERPLLGYGLGSFAPEWQYHKPEFLRSHESIKLISDYVSHPHNEILLWAVEGGLIVVLGLGLLFFRVAQALMIVALPQRLLFVALLTPITLHTLLELPFYTSAVHLALFIFLVTSVFNSEINYSPIVFGERPSKLLKLGSVLLITGTTFFFLHAVVANRELGMSGKPYDLPISSSNLYFRELAEGIENKSRLNLAIQARDDIKVDEFIVWAEKEIQNEPSIQLFKLMAIAHQYKQDREELCKTINLAASIYPYDQTLEKSRLLCN